MQCTARYGSAEHWAAEQRSARQSNALEILASSLLWGLLGGISTTVQSKAWQSNAAERGAGHGSALQRKAMQRAGFPACSPLRGVVGWVSTKAMQGSAQHCNAMECIAWQRNAEQRRAMLFY